MPTRRELANAIRVLAMDAVQQANSGHPGAPMGMADIAEVLWRRLHEIQPGQSALVGSRPLRAVQRPRLDAAVRAAASDRLSDRAWKSCKQFPPARQPHRRAPGARPRHRASRPLPARSDRARQRGRHGAGGKDARGRNSTGPVCRSSITTPRYSAATAASWKASRTRPCSLAGTLKLGKLIVFYDDNGISIDGKVNGWFADDTPKRFEAYGWHVHRRRRPGRRGRRAAPSAQRQGESERPSLICCKTMIGWGCADQSRHQGHARRGARRRRGRRGEAALNWTAAAVRGAASSLKAWNHARVPDAPPRASGSNSLAAIAGAHPELAAEFERRMNGKLPARLEPDAARPHLTAAQAVTGGAGHAQVLAGDARM